MRWNGRGTERIYVDLFKLDVETATSEQVDEIIGNRGWVRLSCDCCGATDIPTVVEVGDLPDYESATIQMCERCANKAVQLFESLPNRS